MIIENVNTWFHPLLRPPLSRPLFLFLFLNHVGLILSSIRDSERRGRGEGRGKWVRTPTGGISIALYYLYLTQRIVVVHSSSRYRQVWKVRYEHLKVGVSLSLISLKEKIEKRGKRETTVPCNRTMVSV